MLVILIAALCALYAWRARRWHSRIDAAGASHSWRAKAVEESWQWASAFAHVAFVLACVVVAFACTNADGTAFHTLVLADAVRRWLTAAVELWKPPAWLVLLIVCGASVPAVLVGSPRSAAIPERVRRWRGLYSWGLKYVTAAGTLTLFGGTMSSHAVDAGARATSMRDAYARLKSEMRLGIVRPVSEELAKEIVEHAPASLTAVVDDAAALDSARRTLRVSVDSARSQVQATDLLRASAATDPRHWGDTPGESVRLRRPSNARREALLDSASAAARPARPRDARSVGEFVAEPGWASRLRTADPPPDATTELLERRVRTAEASHAQWRAEADGVAPEPLAPPGSEHGRESAREAMRRELVEGLADVIAEALTHGLGSFEYAHRAATLLGRFPFAEPLVETAQSVIAGAGLVPRLEQIVERLSSQLASRRTTPGDADGLDAIAGAEAAGTLESRAAVAELSLDVRVVPDPVARWRAALESERAHLQDTERRVHRLVRTDADEQFWLQWGQSLTLNAAAVRAARSDGRMPAPSASTQQVLDAMAQDPAPAWGGPGIPTGLNVRDFLDDAALDPAYLTQRAVAGARIADSQGREAAEALATWGARARDRSRRRLLRLAPDARYAHVAKVLSQVDAFPAGTARAAALAVFAAGAAPVRPRLAAEPSFALLAPHFSKIGPFAGSTATLGPDAQLLRVCQQYVGAIEEAVDTRQALATWRAREQARAAAAKRAADHAVEQAAAEQREAERKIREEQARARGEYVDGESHPRVEFRLPRMP